MNAADAKDLICAGCDKPEGSAAPDHLTIVFEDESLIAINKPEGLLVHRSDIDRHETRFALQLLRDQVGRRVYPIHRLDKPTSGILLFALDADTARLMGQLVTDGAMIKTYMAVVRGYTADQGVIDYPLREQLDRLADPLADRYKDAQEAVTAYERLGACEIDAPVGRYDTARYSLVKLVPKTGRKHQLRRHMKHIFHPIVGDTTHGDGRHNRFFRDQFACHRLLLAATELAFAHPHTQQAITITAPPTRSFCVTVRSLGLLESIH